MNRRTMLKATSAAALLPLAAEALSAQGPDSGATADSVYELRTYHLNPGKLAPINDRFHLHTTKLFERHGIHIVGFWTPVDDPDGHTLVYILRYKNLVAAKENWAAFQADPEWVKLKAETEKDGPFSTKMDSLYLKLTDYSPKV